MELYILLDKEYLLCDMVNFVTNVSQMQIHNAHYAVMCIIVR